MMEYGLDELKREYMLLEKKYNLPNFQFLNEEFDIEKLQERKTELLLKGIRGIILEKATAYLKFVEMFMNPSNAPMFFLSLMKNMSNDSRKIVDELYLSLGKFEIKSISLDNNYNEEKEAKFIKDFLKDWEKIKDNFNIIIEDLESSWEKKAEKKDKGYLG